MYGIHSQIYLHTFMHSICRCTSNLARSFFFFKQPWSCSDIFGAITAAIIKPKRLASRHEHKFYLFGRESRESNWILSPAADLKLRRQSIIKNKREYTFAIELSCEMIACYMIRSNRNDVMWMMWGQNEKRMNTFLQWCQTNGTRFFRSSHLSGFRIWPHVGLQ